MSKDANFTTLLADVKDSTSNSYSPSTALVQGITYYWRVRSRAINLTSEWVTGSFTTVGATPTPNITATSQITPTTAPASPGSGSVNLFYVVITALIAGTLATVITLMVTRARKRQ
jgi:hypothetical protein